MLRAVGPPVECCCYFGVFFLFFFLFSKIMCGGKCNSTLDNSNKSLTCGKIEPIWPWQTITDSRSPVGSTLRKWIRYILVNRKRNLTSNKISSKMRKISALSWPEFSARNETIQSENCFGLTGLQIWSDKFPDTKFMLQVQFYLNTTSALVQIFLLCQSRVQRVMVE